VTAVDLAAAIAGYLVVFFVPGLLWTRVLLQGRFLEPLEVCVYSFLVGLVMVSGSAFFSSFLLRIPLGQVSASGIFALLTLASIAVLAWQRDPGLLRLRWIFRGPGES